MVIADATTTLIVNSGSLASALRTSTSAVPAPARQGDPVRARGEDLSRDRAAAVGPGRQAAVLDVRNVAATQGFATSDGNEDAEPPIAATPDGPSAAALDPGDVSETSDIAFPDRKAGETEEEAPVEKTVIEGEKLRQGDGRGQDGLTEDERQTVNELKARDREVRSHEQAHRTAGGSFVGPPRFRFVRGPDGQFYAAGGEVSINATPVAGNPKATIAKMQVIKRAALAPQQPSGQDQRVASEAEAKIIQAKQELRQIEQTEQVAAQKKKEQRRAEQENLKGPRAAGDKPVFDPEARFDANIGGTGPAFGAGLAGTGDLKVDVAGTLDAGALFNLVA